MLSIESLSAKVEEKSILNQLNLKINKGEVHAIMGPNGAGKSTLCNILTGRDGYEVTHGGVQYNNEDLLALSPEERAQRGIFMSFQYPIEIPGVSMANFLKAALNSQRKAKGQSEIDSMDLLSLIKSHMEYLEIPQEFLYRSVNEGFSGGEKKRNEILQMLTLDPSLCILDETDSGLDIDALKIVAKGINAMRKEDKSILLVTHYQRLLDYVEPDFIHILKDGKIVKSGDKTLAHKLENEGYAGVMGDENG